VSKSPVRVRYLAAGLRDGHGCSRPVQPDTSSNSDPSGSVKTSVFEQSSDTSMLIFSIPRLIEYSSTIFDLVPDDVIAMGTPAGVGSTRKPPVLKPGDVVEVEIENIGRAAQPRFG